MLESNWLVFNCFFLNPNKISFATTLWQFNEFQKHVCYQRDAIPVQLDFTKAKKFIEGYLEPIDDKEELNAPKDKNINKVKKDFDKQFYIIMDDNGEDVHGISQKEARILLDKILMDKVKEKMNEIYRMLDEGDNLMLIDVLRMQNFYDLFTKFYFALQTYFPLHIVRDALGEAVFSTPNDQVLTPSIYTLLENKLGLNRTKIRKLLCKLLNYELYGLNTYKEISASDQYSNQRPYPPYEEMLVRVSDNILVYRLLKEESTDIYSDIFKYNGMFYGSYCTYKEQNSGKSFCIQSSYVDDRFYFSKVLSSSFFLNGHEFCSDEEKTIFLFGDMRVAIKLSNLYHNETQIKDVVISGFLGEKLSTLPWEKMKGNHVVYVPAPSMSSIVLAKAIKTYLNMYGVLTYKIATRFILHRHINLANTNDLPAFEKKLLINAIFPDEYGGYSKKVYEILNTIIKENESTISYTQFYRKWHDAGYIEFSKDDGEMCQDRSEEEDTTELFNFELLDDSDAIKEVSEDYSLDELLSPKYITLILGDSDAGKGYFAYTLSLAVAYGFSVFGFKVKKKRKVLYIDFETAQDDMQKKKGRILSSYDSINKNENFYVITDKEIDFEDDNSVKKFEKSIAHNGFELIVLDNVAKASATGMGQPNKTTKLYNILGQWSEKYKITTLVCHHTNEDGKSKGSNQYEELAQNVFVLRGREIIKQLNKENELSREQKLALNIATESEKTGVLFSLFLKKCKRYPSLYGINYWFLNKPDRTNNLPKKWQRATATGWLEDAPLSEKMLEESIPKSVVVTESVSVGEFAEEDSPKNSAEIKVSLSDKDRRVLKIIYKIGNNGIKRSDIVSRYIEDTQDTDFNETKARGSIDKFRDRFLDNAYITDARLYRILEDKRAEVEEELSKLP